MIERFKNELNLCIYKSQLEKILKEIQSQDLNKMRELYHFAPKEYIDFALLLRQKIIDLVLKKGDIGESFYLICYLVFEPIQDLESTEDLKPFIQTAQSHFLEPALGDIENLMLLELEVLCLILSSQSHQAIKRYIQGISHLEMHLSVMGRASDFIRECFPKMGITMEQFLESMGEILESSYYLKLPIIRARSILNWQLHCFWNIPHFFNHRSWLSLYPLWRELFYHYLASPKREELDHAMYMQFFIYHMCGNSYASQGQWREFCLEIDQVACKYYEKFGKEHALMGAFSDEKQNDSKIIIGILRDRIVENSPYKVEYSFLKQLLSSEQFRSQYQIKIYLMSLLEKSDNAQNIIQSYKQLGIEIVDVGLECNAKGFYNSHLQKALKLNEAIRKDRVQVLISPNNGYGISDFVLSLRSAPKQIFWSHGNFVYDIPSIDCKMTHICGNSKSIVHENYSFVGVPVVMDQEFYNPPVLESTLKQYRLKYPKDKRILGTIGRLTKIDSLPYLTMLVDLMQEFPDTIYLACGSGNIEEIQNKLKSILAQDYEEFMQRFYFCGYVDSAIYGHLIDFWLDSFPMEQGESRIEYVAKGKLSLVLVKNPDAVKKEWKTMAISQEDYREKARYLLNLNQEEKQELIEQIMGGLSRYNQKREELGVESFLEVLNAKDSHSNRL